MMKRALIRDRNGGNDLIPLMVLGGAVLLVIIGLVFANFFFFTTEDLPDDNGRFLDEEIVDRGDPFLFIELSGYGTIKIDLAEDKAPKTTANMEKLCNQGFYDGLTFHRVIPGFMIQGGDPNGDGTGGPGYTIEPETNNGLTHDRGVIAMAKRGGETRMSGSQFYIVHGQDGAHHLDGEHTVFGKVIEGMDVVDSIAETQTDSNDRPLNTVLISDMYIEYE
jgi:cyclophilin family peptidyl-prolyl cis-trans isomerase